MLIRHSNAAQGFTLIEGNMRFINDVISAGIMVDEFNEYGAVKSDEVFSSVVRNRILQQSAERRGDDQKSGRRGF